MKNKQKKYHSGFSIIELMVSIFILSVIMLTSVSIFASVVLVRKNTNKSLNNVSASREAIQVMAKNMRVGSQLSYSPSANAVYFLSEATSSSMCLSYRFYNNSIESTMVSPKVLAAGALSCAPTDVSYSSYIQMINPEVVVSGLFAVTPTSNVSGSKAIGRGTISVLVDGKDVLQTTVSFLTYAGII